MENLYVKTTEGKVLELPVFYLEDAFAQKLMPKVSFKGYIYDVDTIDARRDIEKVGYTREEVEQ